jgi:hypothetical protein
MKTAIGGRAINLSDDKERPFGAFTHGEETNISSSFAKIDFIGKASVFDVFRVNGRKALGHAKEVVYAYRYLKHDYSSERV